MSSSRRTSLFYVIAAMTLLPSIASAQLAPTGNQYAARTSDTGFEGSVNSQGGYGASVPLELPPARGGLPLPLQIVYTGRGVGAAGLGWDVPLTYIFRSISLAGQKPLTPDGAPEGRLRMTLILDGKSMNLVQKGGSATVWVPQTDGPQLEVHDKGDGTMTLFDGNGLTYNFSAQGASAGSRLSQGNLFLLTSVIGRGNIVLLTHQITNPVLPGGGTGFSVNLTKVTYNSSVTNSNCLKTQIVLSYGNPDYGAPAIEPLSMRPFDDVLVRTDVLNTVDVTVRRNCTDPAVRTRRYLLKYPSADPDTQLPRLSTVQVVGRKDTNEETRPISLGTYSYATASKAVNGGGRTVHYELTETIPLPSNATPFDIAYSGITAPLYNPNNYNPDENTWQTFTDFTGDGRPDFVYNHHDSNGDTMFLASQLPLPALDLALPLSSTVFGGRPIEIQQATGASRHFTPRDYLWRQMIDFNGDGRVDIVDAREVKGSWVVYLNTPNGPTDITWKRIVLDVSNLLTRFKNLNYHVDDDSGFMPLASHAIGKLVHTVGCWQYDGGPVLDSRSWELVTQGNCSLFEIQRGPEKTYTEWELRDLNADGFPDVVMNAGPMTFEGFGFIIPSTVHPPFAVGTIVNGASDEQDVYPSTEGLMAAFNASGTHLVDGGSLEWADPTTIKGASNRCGVAQWQEIQFATNSESAQDRLTQQVCGFADVNGDGLLDRIEGTTAFLHVGGFLYQAATVTLPGPMTLQDSDHRAVCGQNGPGGYGIFAPDFLPHPGLSHATRVAALIDINGDGIPDYVDGVHSILDTNLKTLPQVHFGTGTGFAPPIPIDNGLFSNQPGFFPLSANTEDCFGNISITEWGVFDADGDGKVDLIGRPDDGSANIIVAQLKAGFTAGTPEAGRLVQLDNGFGAKTNITYSSAKQDQTFHAVPFPEIVVSAVETVDDSQSPVKTLVEKTRYAYGQPELVHDATFDRFVFSGYRRTVKLQMTQDPLGNATITDTNPLTPLPTGTPLSNTDRFTRELRVGRLRDVTLLSGEFADDPSELLSVNINTDLRVIGGTHYDWSARLFEETAANADPRCVEMVDPYDFNSSASQAAFDPCTAHGFAFQFNIDSWRGAPASAPPSPNNVHTRTLINSVDDYGRTLTTVHINDVDAVQQLDALTIQDIYATTIPSGARTLNAPTERRTTDISGTITYAHELWVRNADGLPTQHTVFRMGDHGEQRDVMTAYDATYDAVDNLKTTTSTREDGATNTVTANYDLNIDPFAMAPTSITSTGTGGAQPVQPLTFTITRDLLSMKVLSKTDPNGAASGATYDGFDRMLLSTVTPAGGVSGALSSTCYRGFSIGETGGRTFVRSLFTDPTAPKDATCDAGRKSTVYLDQLGREQDTVIELGASYGSQTVISGSRTYDTLGRVVFEADPFPSSQDVKTAYGTTHYFNIDGTPLCSVRGNGPQDFTMVTDEANEIYPTCSSRTYANHQELLSTRGADSLLGNGPQTGFIETIARGSSGKVLNHSTWQNGVRLEYADYAFDAVGHMTQLRRYQDPVGLSSSVATSWHTDSLGQVFELDEPGSAPKTRTYSRWRELTDEHWNDTAAAVDHHTIKHYDAFSRLVHSEETKNGHSDPETVDDYQYDQPVSIIGPVTVVPSFVLGRLAQATSPTGSVSFGYDGLGRVASKAFTDSQQGLYVEQHSYHGDGSLLATDLLLPDNLIDDPRSDSGLTDRDEHVDYGYDSAARMKSLSYSDGASSEDVFEATTIDVFGRVRDARYGATHYTADYADTGRRLPKTFSFFGAVNSAGVVTSRTIELVAPGGEPRALDPVARERGRRETVNGGTPITTSYSYDAIGRLAGATRPDASGVATSDAFVYNPLGNLTELFNSGQVENPTNANILYNTSGDLDRMCRVDYAFNHGTACNVQYDQAGNIATMPTPSGATRSLDYLANGQVRTVSDNAGDTAHYQYDAFGAPQQLDIVSIGTPSQTRHDRHYGSMIDLRDEVVDGTPQSVVTRTISGPAGFTATRHGATATWVFGFGEGRGNRFFTDQSGNFVQDVTYSPFGKIKTAAASPSPLYSSAQWNHGDSIEALGVSQLGARLYDPNLGRFLSRDPLLIPRSASMTNPYAFALNDPVNLADPSGMDISAGGACNGAEDCPGLGGVVPYLGGAALDTLVLPFINNFWGPSSFPTPRLSGAVTGWTGVISDTHGLTAGEAADFWNSYREAHDQVGTLKTLAKFLPPPVKTHVQCMGASGAVCWSVRDDAHHDPNDDYRTVGTIILIAVALPVIFELGAIAMAAAPAAGPAAQALENDAPELSIGIEEAGPAEADILGRAFRAVNDAHLPNAAAAARAQTLFVDEGVDCSEIAEKLFEAAGGEGAILRAEPAMKGSLRLLENGIIEGNQWYHEVYTDGRYVFDLRTTRAPIPLGDWYRLMRALNLGVKIFKQ